MLSFLRDLFRILPGIIAAVIIATVSTLFLVFPRVVNDLANIFGNMGDPLDLGQGLIHLAVAVVIWGVIGYFYIYRPIQQFRFARSAKGLIVGKGRGIGFMDAESVRQQIFAAVARISEVQRMEVSVINDMGKAEIYLNILSGNRINAAQKKQEIRREVKKVVEDTLGITMAAEPVINIKLVPIFEDLPYAAPADASYASAYSGLRTLPAPSPSTPVRELEAVPNPAKPAEPEPFPPAATIIEADVKPVETKPAPAKPVTETESPVIARRQIEVPPKVENTGAAEKAGVVVEVEKADETPAEKASSDL